MTADIRAKVYCNLGNVISGSFQESTAIGSGLITVEGSLLLSGSVSAPEGAPLELAYYDPSTNRIRRLGPKFKVLSAVYNPATRETTVIFADTLGFLAEYEAPRTLVSSAGDTSTDDVQYDDMTEVQKAVLKKPMSSEYLAQQALRFLGLSGSVGTYMKFYVDKIEIDGSILAYVNDLAISSNRAVYSRDGTVTSFPLMESTNSIVIPWDDVIDINPSGDGIRAASNIYITYNSLSLDFDADGLESTNTDDEGVAYTLYNNSYGWGDDLVINYSYYDPELDENIEQVHEEPVSLNSYEEIRFDEKSRDIYNRQIQYGTYGATETLKTTEYGDFVVGYTLPNFYDYSPREREILYGISSTISFTTNKQYTQARNRAIAINELSLYEADPFGYTFGYDVEPEDLVPEEAKITTTYEITTVTEPLAQFLSSAGLPTQCYNLKPLIPPTYRAFGQGDYVSSKTYVTTRETAAGTYTVEDVYEARHKTQEGANQMTKIMEMARTTEEGEVVNFEDLDPNFLQTLRGDIISYGATTLAHVSHRSTYSQKYFNLESWKEDQLNGIEDEGATDKGTSSAYSIIDTELVESISPSPSPGINLTYTPPYTSDDYIIRDGSNSFGAVYKVVKSNAAAEARLYGITQNRLRLGKAHSLSIVVPIKYYDPIPHRACSLELDGVWGSYIIDSQSVAFDSNGILMSADLLLKGTVV